MGSSRGSTWGAVVWRWRAFFRVRVAQIRVKGSSVGLDVGGKEIDDVLVGEGLAKVDVPEGDHAHGSRGELAELAGCGRPLEADRPDRVSHIGAREGEGRRGAAPDIQIDVADKPRDAHVVLIFAVHVRKGPGVLSWVVADPDAAVLVVQGVRRCPRMNRPLLGDIHVGREDLPTQGYRTDGVDFEDVRIVVRVETRVLEQASEEAGDRDWLAHRRLEGRQPRLCVLQLACDVGLERADPQAEVQIAGRLDAVCSSPRAERHLSAPGYRVERNDLLLEEVPTYGPVLEPRERPGIRDRDCLLRPISDSVRA